MPERSIDLKDQRLAISQNLGDDFVRAIESPQENEQMSDAVIKTRQALFNNPDIQILGYRLNEGDGFKEIEASLSRQMGLPHGFSLRDVKDRIAGREKDFLLVITGLNQLSINEKEKLQKNIKQHLHIESLFE